MGWRSSAPVFVKAGFAMTAKGIEGSKGAATIMLVLAAAVGTGFLIGVARIEVVAVLRELLGAAIFLGLAVLGSTILGRYRVK
jgi:hypothetical protein